MAKNPQRLMRDKLRSLMRLICIAGAQTDRGGVAWYPISVVVAHLEQQFQPGMTWDNYGSGMLTTSALAPASI